MKQSTRDVLEQIKVESGDHEVLQTGLKKFDQTLDGGFFSKEVIILGAHTGVGKSQLAGQIMLNIVYQGFKSAYFSLEISNEMILSRLLGIITNIKPTMLRFTPLSEYEIKKKQEAEIELISKGDLFNFYDNCYKIEEIVKEIKDNKYEFVVVDFIQNIISNADEYTRLSNAAITLQKTAKEASCTILILSQLSNTAAKDGSRSKTLEYKGSGSIAMVADLGLFLERQGDDDGEFIPDGNTVLTIKKNRRGYSGSSFVLGFTEPGGKIYEK